MGAYTKPAGVLTAAQQAQFPALPVPAVRRRWSLWMAEDGSLRANAITPTWGGGGLVVVPEAGS